MQLKVARLGKPHGIRGEITAELFTDDPQSRFTPGAELITDPAARGPLTLTSLRWNKTVALLRFEGVNDRSQAELLRGTELFFDSTDEEDSDDDGWYEHEILGLEVKVGEQVVGKVAELRTLPVQDLLVVETAEGKQLLVPFVEEIVPEIDIEAGHILITPPPGLLELNDEPEAEDADEASTGESASDAASGNASETGADKA